MKYTIGKFASRPVIGVEGDASVLDALKLMSAHRISCVIIMSCGEPVGILTERDVIFASNWVLGQADLLVKEVMNKPVMTGSENMGIAQAHKIFCQHHIRHLVVLDNRLDMVGIFTQTDLVRSLREKVFADISDLSTLMSPQVLHVSPDVPARYALSLMARRSVSCVVVVDGEQPVGMFTERDVVRLIADNVDFKAVSVGEVMTPTVVSTPMTVTPDETVTLMQKNAIRRLVVLDAEGKMTGILTQTDLGRVLEQQNQDQLNRLFGDKIESADAQSPRCALQ
ncbi:MAG: CBS domain-containing protein [Desulfuromonadales bacterium]|nr:CBS domain-containing protein [Desulfuromonadales bacterium]